MRERIFRILGTLFLGLAAFNSNAQDHPNNLLDKQVFGFEESANPWFMQNKEFFSLTNEKAASGKISLKFACDDAAKMDKKVQVQSGSKKDVDTKYKVNLDAGDYIMYVKVFAAEEAPKSFNINVFGGEFTPVNFKLDKVEKGKWVELSQKISLGDIKDGKLHVSVSANPKFGGAGVFYVDDIAIEKVK